MPPLGCLILCHWLLLRLARRNRRGCCVQRPLTACYSLLSTRRGVSVRAGHLPACLPPQPTLNHRSPPAPLPPIPTLPCLNLPTNPTTLQVAMQYSEDKARQGGDLGWKRRNEVVPAFADAAFALNVRLAQPIWPGLHPPAIPAMAQADYVRLTVLCLPGWLAPPRPALQVGEMTQQPIKTEFGYHLILCEGRK